MFTKNESLLTQSELKSQLKYDPDTGLFAWASLKRGVTIGKVAGSLKPSGYVIILVNRKMFRAHRLAWLYMTGRFPAKSVDHINRIKNDNRWCNLRDASHSENFFNMGIKSSNTSGYKGVSFNKQLRKWDARATVNKQQTCLGLFDTPELASEAYREFAKNNHAEFYCETVG